MIHRRTVAPVLAAEHITLADAKAHLRVTSSAEDTLIQRLISAVRQMAEDRTGRALCTSTWVAVLDSFQDGGDPCGRGIRLPAPPLASISSVTYVDTNGATQPLDSSAYLLDQDSEPAWLYPAYNTTWPCTREQPNAVRITCVCGYPVGTLPESLRQWMFLHLGHAYENREASADNRLVELPYTSGLIEPYTVLTWS